MNRLSSPGTDIFLKDEIPGLQEAPELQPSLAQALLQELELLRQEEPQKPTS